MNIVSVECVDDISHKHTSKTYEFIKIYQTTVSKHAVFDASDANPVRKLGFHRLRCKN